MKNYYENTDIVLELELILNSIDSGKRMRDVGSKDNNDFGDIKLNWKRKNNRFWKNGFINKRWKRRRDTAPVTERH